MFKILLISFCLIATLHAVDWDLLKQNPQKLQSAIDKKDERAIVEPAIKILDLVPSEVHHYMVGLTTGARYGLTYQSTGHLTGSHSSFSMNLLRDYDTKCLHIASGIKGPIVLITGKNETLKVCAYSTIYGAPSGYIKVVSFVDNLDVFDTLKANSVESALAIHSKFIFDYSEYPVAIPINEINYDNFPTTSKLTFLFGHTATNCHGSHCFMEFRTYGKARFDPAKKNFIGHLNNIAECVECSENLFSLFNATVF